MAKNQLVYRCNVENKDGQPIVKFGCQAHDGDQFVGTETWSSGNILDALGYQRPGSDAPKTLNFGKSSGTWFLRPKAPKGVKDPTLDLGPFLFGSARMAIFGEFDLDRVQREAAGWNAGESRRKKNAEAGQATKVAELQIASEKNWQLSTDLSSSLMGQLMPPCVRMASAIDKVNFVGPAPIGDPKIPVGKGRFLKVGSPNAGDLFAGIDLETGLVNLCKVEPGQDESSLTFRFRELKPEVALAAGGSVVKDFGDMKYRLTFKQNLEMTRQITGGGWYIEVEVLEGSEGFFYYPPTADNRPTAERRLFLNAQCVGTRFFDVKTAKGSFAQFGTTNYVADELGDEEIVEVAPTSDPEGEKKGKGKKDKAAVPAT